MEPLKGTLVDPFNGTLIEPVNRHAGTQSVISCLWHKVRGLIAGECERRNPNPKP